MFFFGACCFYAIYVHVTGPVLPYDDSFITFRYVKNFLEGQGLVYNHGERVFGSTTPLFVVWLIILKALFVFAEIPTLAVRGNVLFFLTTACGFLFLFHKYLGWAVAALLCSGLFLIRPDMLAISLGGTETFLFCSLVLWSFYFSIKGKFLLSGTLAGLSIVTRPEGLFCALVIGLGWLLYDRRKPAAFIMSLVVPGLIWTSFAFAYFGTPIYHSLIAKSRPLYSLPAGFALQKILNKLAFWTSGRSDNMVVLAVAMVCSLAGLLFYKNNERKMRFAFPVFVSLVLLLYGLGNPLVFAWYFPIIFIGWLQILVVGLYCFVMEVVERLQKRFGFPMSTSMIRVICTALPVMLLVNSTYFAWHEHKKYTAPGFFGKEADHFRILSYKQIAECLNEVGGHSDTIASPEIGALGYYSRLHIYDACGLVTPEAIPFLPVPYRRGIKPATGSISAEFVRSVDADWVVTMPHFARASLFPSEWFGENYALIARFPLSFETWNDKHVLVYRRNKGYASSGDSVADTPNLGRKALQSSNGVLVPY